MINSHNHLEHLAKKNTPIHLLLSHNHWDHIQGFPFFPPIYQAEREINIYPGQTLFEEPDQILKQMEGSLFPVPRSALRANISLIEIPKADNTFAIGSAKITRLAMNHPGSGSAYCINADGVKVTYITDNELYPPYKKETDFIDFAKFAENADLLIHDAQYMLSDMPAKNGWGHSVAEEAVKLAMASNAKKLALYSHDPERTDDDIDDVVKHCNEYVTVAESTLHVFASSEGLTLDFS